MHDRMDDGFVVVAPSGNRRASRQSACIRQSAAVQPYCLIRWFLQSSQFLRMSSIIEADDLCLKMKCRSPRPFEDKMEKLRIQSTVARGTGLLFCRARNGYATGHGSFCSPRLKEEGPGEKEGSATQRVARLERLLHHDCAILGLQKFPDIIAHPSRHFPASIHPHTQQCARGSPAWRKTNSSGSAVCGRAALC